MDEEMVRGVSGYLNELRRLHTDGDRMGVGEEIFEIRGKSRIPRTAISEGDIAREGRGHNGKRATNIALFQE